MSADRSVFIRNCIKHIVEHGETATVTEFFTAMDQCSTEELEQLSIIGDMAKMFSQRKKK